jgi:hypothetical protein
MIESRFELRTFGSDTMLNHHLSQKFKRIERGKFNHLINTLIDIINFFGASMRCYVHHASFSTIRSIAILFQNYVR